MSTRDRGASLVELLIGLALLSIVVTMALPVAGHAVDGQRARDAAGFMAARLRFARQQAALQAQTAGLVFDRADDGWQVRTCLDGNGNGLRRAEIAAGVDRCPDSPIDVARLFPGVALDADPALRGPDNEPGTDDPVRFGASDIASFSPEGSGTAGSVYLRSSRGRRFLVRVGNVTGRIRVLRYDAGSRTWR